MTVPDVPPTAPPPGALSRWLPWVAFAALGAFLVLRWMGLLGGSC